MIKKNNIVSNYDVVIVIDCGKNGFTYYCNDWKIKESKKISRGDLLKLPENFQDKKALFISEDSHLGQERNIRSLAQPFLGKELQQFYNDCDKYGHTLKLFPQLQMETILKATGYDKSDATDPLAIYDYMISHNQILNNAKNPVKSFTIPVIRKESYELKDDMNFLLNFARRFNYGRPTKENKLHFSKDEVANFLFENMEEIASKISDDAKLIFGLSDDSRYKTGNLNPREINMAGLYSLVSPLIKGEVVQDDDGKWIIKASLRTRPNTKSLAGWSYASKYLLCFSPFHLKGGIARSNLKFHNFKSFYKKKAEESGLNLYFINSQEKKKFKRKGEMNKEEREFFDDCQRKHRIACKEVFLAVKEILEEEECFVS